MHVLLVIQLTLSVSLPSLLSPPLPCPPLRLPSSCPSPPLPSLPLPLPLLSYLYPSQFAQLYADNVSVTADVLKYLMAWPLECPPSSGEQLRMFEVYHEMIDLYLWLGCVSCYCVCVRACVHACMCVHILVHTEGVCVCLYIHMYASTACMCLYVCVSLCVCVSVNVYVSVCVCL